MLYEELEDAQRHYFHYMKKSQGTVSTKLFQALKATTDPEDMMTVHPKIEAEM